jgi:hypothetical protein
VFGGVGGGLDAVPVLGRSATPRRTVGKRISDNLEAEVRRMWTR